MTDSGRPSLAVPKRPLEYRGELSSKIIAEGASLAMANAARLLADARELARLDRHPSAVALAIVAIEEDAKADLLFALATWPAEAEVFWKMFRRHPDKNALGFVPLLKPQGRIETLIWLHDHAGDKYFDAMKWTGLYLDLLQTDDGVPFWSDPMSMVSAAHSGFFIRQAETLISPRIVTAAEVDLMKREFKPAQQRSLEEWDAAMKAYLQGAVDAGLRPFQQWMADDLGVEPRAVTD